MIEMSVQQIIESFCEKPYKSMTDTEIAQIMKEKNGLDWLETKKLIESSNNQLETLFAEIESNARTLEELTLGLEELEIKNKLEELEKIEDVKEEETPVTGTPFPLEVFPEQIQRFVKTLAEVRNVNPDYVACSVLALVNTLSGKNYVFNPDTDLKSNGNLYFALVGKAGDGKTPSIMGVLDTIRQAELELNKEYQDKYSAWKKQVDKNKQLRKKAKKGEECDIEDPEKPSRTSLMINDSTMEARVALLAESPACLQVFDELTTLLSSANQYKKNGSDIEKYLSIWTGQDITVDRVSSERVVAENPRLSIVGAMVPGNLEKFAKNIIAGDGLLDRFLFCCPDKYKGTISLTKKMDKDAVEWATKFFEKLYRENYKPQIHAPELAKKVPITLEALQLLEKDFVQWKTWSEEKNSGFYSKFLAHALNLTNALATLWQVSYVDVELMSKVLSLCKYFIDSITSKAGVNLSQVVEKTELEKLEIIRKKAKREYEKSGSMEVTARQIQRWGVVKTSKEAQALLEAIITYEYGFVDNERSRRTIKVVITKKFLNLDEGE